MELWWNNVQQMHMHNYRCKFISLKMESISWNLLFHLCCREFNNRFFCTDTQLTCLSLFSWAKLHLWLKVRTGQPKEQTVGLCNRQQSVQINIHIKLFSSAERHKSAICYHGWNFVRVHDLLSYGTKTVVERIRKMPESDCIAGNVVESTGRLEPYSIHVGRWLSHDDKIFASMYLSR